MSTHTKPPPRADQTDQAAEPARREPRFDERGIALQTVIIMVVMLAIAGAVAAVLLTRGSETTAQLEAQGVSAVVAANIKSQALCGSTSGVQWDANECRYDDNDACAAAGGTATGATAGRPCTDKDGNVIGNVK